MVRELNHYEFVATDFFIYDILLCNHSFFLHIYFTDVATATDLLPLIPPQTGEKILDDTSRYYLDSLMEFMVTQVHKFLNSNNKRGKFHEFFKTL